MEGLSWLQTFVSGKEGDSAVLTDTTSYHPKEEELYHLLTLVLNENPTQEIEKKQQLINNN